MNYATQRLLDAANNSLTAWEGEEDSVREEHAELIEELEAAIHYFNAHGEKFSKLDWLVIQSAVSNSDIEPEDFRQRLLDKIGGEV